MKKYFCDVCGAETTSGENAPSSWAAELCRLEDLCPRCWDIVQTPSLADLVLAELRRMATEQVAASPPVLSATPPPSPKGKAAKEKREILAAIEAYRQQHGPGSIPQLAKLTKVGEGELRDMISCAPLPMVTWRKVGRALGVAGADGKPEAAP